MSNICLGLTAKKEKCNAKVKRPERYCYRHKHQNKSKNYKPLIPIVSKDFDDVCSICQCDVEKEEDCDLLCGHRHHIDCIKQVIKNECPVCREPLVFGKKTNINVDEIKEKEYNYSEEMRINQDATNELIAQLANEHVNNTLNINNTLNNNNTSNINNTLNINNTSNINNTLNNSLPKIKNNVDDDYQTAIKNSLKDLEEENMKRVLEESLLQQEIDEYELEAKIIHDSYWEREQKERERFDKLKNLSLDDWIHAIFEDSPSIIVKLQ